MGQLSIQNVLRHMFAHNCFHVVRLCALKKFFFYLLILEKGKDRERERERGRETSILLFHLRMHSLVDSCMCHDRGSNLRPWHIGTML